MKSGEFVHEDATEYNYDYIKVKQRNYTLAEKTFMENNNIMPMQNSNNAEYIVSPIFVVFISRSGFKERGSFSGSKIRQALYGS
jgi:hypothetical protein